MIDLEKVYDEELAPLMDRIIAVCKQHDLPFVACFQYADEAFCTSAILPESAHARLKRGLAILHPESDESIGRGGVPSKEDSA